MKPILTLKSYLNDIINHKYDIAKIEWHEDWFKERYDEESVDKFLDSLPDIDGSDFDLLLKKLKSEIRKTKIKTFLSED